MSALIEKMRRNSLVIYSGLQVIVNRTTQPHHDSEGCHTHFDLLVSLGTHTSLQLCEMGIYFEYVPGTIISICDKVLLHEVEGWKGGERICVAHFIKDDVHSQIDVPRPAWPLYPYKSFSHK
jgi:hypothetical protein